MWIRWKVLDDQKLDDTLIKKNTTYITIKNFYKVYNKM